MSPNSKKRLSKSSKLAVTAMLTLPIVGGAHYAVAQSKEGVSSTATRRELVIPHILEKSGLRFSIEGIENGHTIYKDENGKLFYLNPKTGDQKFLAAGHTIKLKNADISGLRSWPMKFKGEITLLGVDADGNSIQKNAKGEKFYLDATTGDMVFVK